MASILSVELGVTVALIELTLGVAVGNIFDLGGQEWLEFIASFASIVLTFLAGMEVDHAYMRRRLEASVWRWSTPCSSSAGSPTSGSASY